MKNKVCDNNDTNKFDLNLRNLFKISTFLKSEEWYISKMNCSSQVIFHFFEACN